MDKHFLNGRTICGNGKDDGFVMFKQNNVMMSLSEEKELQNATTENRDILIYGTLPQSQILLYLVTIDI